MKSFIVELDKQYPVVWEDDCYEDDGDMFLGGIVDIDGNKQPISLNMMIDPFSDYKALKKVSFVIFKTYQDNPGKESGPELYFIPIEHIELAKEPPDNYEWFSEIDEIIDNNHVKTFDDGTE